MLVEPFVVIAQIINFLILVALLKHFLYKPITQAMEGRAQKIERQLAVAASKEKDAAKEKELYRQKQQKFKVQKTKLFTIARQEVKQEKAKLTQQARYEVNILRSQWYKDFERDRHQINNEIRHLLAKQVTFTARKALIDLAKANLEEEIIETFIDRLYHLNPLQTEIVYTTSIPYPKHVIHIHSSFEISQDKKERLITAIRQKISAKAEVQFKISEDFVCGIELRDRGYKISWNLEHYLTELETETAKILAKNNQNLIEV